VEPEFDQSAAYVEGWLQAMNEDSRAIFRAASEAQKAVDYIMERTARADRMAAE
jgi:antirestriction protein ArdC